jgi:hypothetical protein
MDSLRNPGAATLVAEALDRYPNAFIIYNPDIVAFWNRTGELDVEALPLVRYSKLASMDHYYLLVRNERP